MGSSEPQMPLAWEQQEEDVERRNHRDAFHSDQGSHPAGKQRPECGDFQRVARGQNATTNTSSDGAIKNFQKQGRRGGRDFLHTGRSVLVAGNDRLWLSHEFVAVTVTEDGMKRLNAEVFMLLDMCINRANQCTQHDNTNDSGFNARRRLRSMQLLKLVLYM
jgi:hypothetical protein